MPKWNTHLYVADKLNEKMELKGQEKEEFYLGSVLPDINNGWLVKGVHKRILHDETHICAENEFAWTHFYEKYKKNIQNREPIFLGYLLHLFTDARFNDDYYEAIKGTWIENEEKDDQRILKQEDFGKFDDRLGRNGFQMKNIAADAEMIKKIEEVDVNEEDLARTNEYLAREDRMPVEKNYNFYDEDRLLGVAQGIVEDFYERFL